MVKRTSFENAECPIARSLDAIGDWWSLLIIRDALLGMRRFGEFQKSLGLAKNILTVRLRALVDHGILKTAPASDGSAYQEYVLTPKGRGVFPVLVALRQWSEEFARPAGGDRTTSLVDREKGRPVQQARTARPQDGRLLTRRYRAMPVRRREAGASRPGNARHDSLRLPRSRSLPRFQLRHLEQTAEHVEPVAPGQPARSATVSAMKAAASSGRPLRGSSLATRPFRDAGFRRLLSWSKNTSNPCISQILF